MRVVRMARIDYAVARWVSVFRHGIHFAPAQCERLRSILMKAEA
jgi:hypothetical protein